MGVCGQAVTAEDVVACLDNSVIVDVYVCHVNPCPDKMSADVKSFSLYAPEIFLKEHDGLEVCACSVCLLFCQPDALEDAVVCPGGCLHKYADLAAVQWRLFYNSG